MSTYRIVRKYADRNTPDKVIAEGLTYEEKVAHTNDPETASSTATSPLAAEHTAEFGEWFDVSYEE
jgi:hypothetical protein